MAQEKAEKLILMKQGDDEHITQAQDVHPKETKDTHKYTVFTFS